MRECFAQRRNYVSVSASTRAPGQRQASQARTEGVPPRARGNGNGNGNGNGPPGETRPSRLSSMYARDENVLHVQLTGRLTGQPRVRVNPKRLPTEFKSENCDDPPSSFRSFSSTIYKHQRFFHNRCSLHNYYFAYLDLLPTLKNIHT